MKSPGPPRFSFLRLGLTLPAWISAAILAISAAACLILNLPGHLTYDSIVQLDQGRTGIYNLWHPPIMAWLLGWADKITPGAAAFVILEVGLVFGALISLAVMAGRSAWAGPVVALAAAALPQLAIYPAIVWKDVLFAGCALSGFACLAWAARIWPRRPWRWALIGKAAVLFALAALARQNGVVILPFAAGAMVWIAARGSDQWAWRRGFVHGAAFLALAALIIVAGTAALKSRSDGLPERAHQFDDLRIYEIVGARHLDPRTDFPILAAKAPALYGFLTVQGAALYTPQRIDPLVQNAGVQAHEDRDAPFVQAQWSAIFLHDPWLYLRVRAEYFKWVLLTPKLTACVPVAVGVDGPPDLLAKLNIPSRYSDGDDDALTYAQAFYASPAFSHAAWGALALGLLAFLMIRRRPEDLAMAAMLGAALTFTATFFAITIACDYRYLYFLDLSALAGAIYVAGTAGPLRLQRRGQSPRLP